MKVKNARAVEAKAVPNPREQANDWMEILLVGAYRMEKTNDNGCKKVISAHIHKAMKKRNFTGVPPNLITLYIIIM